MCDSNNLLEMDTWRIFRIMGEFVEGFETMSNVGPAVSIFGSSRSAKHDPNYRKARKLAAIILRLWKTGEPYDPTKLTIQAD